MDPTNDEIIALETSFWEAMKAKDGKAAAALAGKTSLVIGVRGVLAADRSKMAAMTTDGAWTLKSYVFDDVQVLMAAKDVATIAYTVRQKVEIDGKTTYMKAAESSTWGQGPDGWACHGHSESMMDT